MKVKRYISCFEDVLGSLCVTEMREGEIELLGCLRQLASCCVCVCVFR